jgi:regulatory protein
MSAYLDALKMLARRELSEAQVRQRLQRRNHSGTAIDAAIARLREEQAIDDARAAAAIARTQTFIKRRGERRVRQLIEQAGIKPETARHVTRQVIDSTDPDAVLEAALARRLRRGDRIADDKEFARLYRYLVRQGFEPERVRAALEKRGAGKIDQ